MVSPLLLISLNARPMEFTDRQDYTEFESLIDLDNSIQTFSNYVSLLSDQANEAILDKSNLTNKRPLIDQELVTDQKKQKIATRLTEKEKKYAHTCNECGKVFEKKNRLEDHIRSVHENNPYICFACNNIFARRDRLVPHIRNAHLERKEYQCEECDKSYTTAKILQRHKKTEHSNQRYECNQCRKQFARNENLKKHIDLGRCPIYKTIEEKLYKCDQCSKSFNKPKALTRHIQADHEMQRFECVWCKAQFKRPDNLTRHLQSRCEVLNSPKA
jgi:uncharacterized Zn-finger protein